MSKQHDNIIQSPPVNWKQKIKWLGPGITWMAAGAGGAGELLFPPRVGSLYGYAFLWALLLAILLKWFVNREIGRYAVCTGRSLLSGYQTLPGPRNWAIWVIVVPQVVVAIASIAGIAGSAATAFVLLFPGSVKVWTGFTVFTGAALLTLGSYKVMEKVAMVFAILLGVIGIVTAISVFPEPDKLIQGLRPQLPANTNYIEIIPWLSFVLAGAAGMTWYSYWIPAKGYGAAGQKDLSTVWKDENNIQKLKGWLREMTLDNSLGVIGGLLIVLAFLILGAELLGPQNLVPEQNKVAAVLGKMLESTWGRAGFWIMIAGVLTGFWNTAMTNQDGWTRLLSNGTAILISRKNIPAKWKDENRLRNGIRWIVLALFPFVVYSIAGEPIGLLQLAGVIEAIHIPVIAGLTLFLNATTLPLALRPSRTALVFNLIACLFFVVFAILYIIQIVEG
jgi:Mn2+/Fe2+ NRAMP family transporter